MTHLAKSDYIWVKGANIDDAHPFGDMDRLKTSFNPDDPIRGIIMPMRTGSADPSRGIRGKNVLSGEDICYLAEGIAERRAITTKSEEDIGQTFTRSIIGNDDRTTASPRSVAYWLRELADRFVKETPESGTYDLDDAECFSRWSASDLMSNPSSFVRGSPLRRVNIEALFSDEQKLNRACVTGSAADAESTRSVIKESYTDEYPILYYPAGLQWLGGNRESGGVPNHARGGKTSSFCNISLTLNLPNVGDTISVLPIITIDTSGDVWINFHAHYLEYAEDGTKTRDETANYLVRVREWQRDMIHRDASLFYTFMYANEVLAVAKKIASEKFNWDFDGQLPDAYGKKTMTLAASSFFTIPVTHTKFWD